MRTPSELWAPRLEPCSARANAGMYSTGGKVKGHEAARAWHVPSRSRGSPGVCGALLATFVKDSPLGRVARALRNPAEEPGTAVTQVRSRRTVQPKMSCKQAMTDRNCTYIVSQPWEELIPPGRKTLSLQSRRHRGPVIIVVSRRPTPANPARGGRGVSGGTDNWQPDDEPLVEWVDGGAPRRRAATLAIHPTLPLGGGCGATPSGTR